MTATAKVKPARRRKEYDFFMSRELGFILGILECGRVLHARQERMPYNMQINLFGFRTGQGIIMATEVVNEVGLLGFA